MKTTRTALLAALACAACGDPESVFTGDRAQVSCAQALPVCSTSAGCLLDNATYAQGAFQQGGSTRFIVRTTGAADVEVALFFKTEQSPGTDTEISWNEVGCQKRYLAQSGGVDVFSEAGQERVYKRSQHLVTAGDHLVEVFSDAQAQVLLKVNISGAQ